MNRAVELKWAAILFVMTLLWKLFEKAMGWHGPRIDRHALYSNFYDMLFVTLFVLALLEKRKKAENGKFSWRQGFLSGIIIAGAITVVSPLTQFLTHRLISPEFFPNVIDFAVDNGVLSRETASAQFNLKNYILQNLIGTSILGTACSLILPIFMIKK